MVACDIWVPYRQVAAHYFPQAQTVIDRFHVVKLLNQLLDMERKKLRQTEQAETDFKHLKWVLFKQFSHCSADERAPLAQARCKAPLPAKLYQLHGSFHELLEEAATKPALKTSLVEWLTQARLLRCDSLSKFTKTLVNWQDSIAAFTDGRVSNVVTKGMNNYLRYMQRISFGLSNFKNMRMRILVASA
ncbi:transposase [Hymenobacter nivis]|uniref:transposase n=1 Tax=Hymenobacter nivis TaxID=1850093 RepID=UPI0013A57A9B|nr:transposase [Hymenobacter nivis]